MERTISPEDIPVQSSKIPVTAGISPQVWGQPDNLSFARNVFESLINRHREARKRLKADTTDKSDNLALAQALGYVQARLLAISYPEETEKIVTRLLDDGKCDLEDIVFATKVLGLLAAQGKTSVEARLLQFAENADPRIATTAVDGLLAHDKQGRYRAVYWKKCSEGLLEVYDLGPYWADGQTKQMLQHIFDRDNSPESPDGFTAEALERLQILESPSRSEKLEQLLSGRAEPGDYTKIHQRQTWALRVVQMDPTTSASEILRQRLDRDEVAAATRQADRVYEPPGPTHPGFVGATGDNYYDEVLLAYFSLGGTPNQFESRRLTYYGYLGDPKERLIALLAEDARARK